MSILPKAIYTFSATAIKISMAYFIELAQIIQKFTWDYKRSLNSHSNLKKKQRNFAT